MKSVLLTLVLCVSALGIDYDPKYFPDPIVLDCVQNFKIFYKYRVSAKALYELESFRRATLEGADDLNPFEIRNAVHALGSHGYFAEVVRSPKFLETTKELILRADTDSFSLPPFNIDVKNSIERFLGHQEQLRVEDPWFDKRPACDAIDFASEYFLDHEAPSLYELMSHYDERFRCRMRGKKRPLNGKFIRKF